MPMPLIMSVSNGCFICLLFAKMIRFSVTLMILVFIPTLSNVGLAQQPDVNHVTGAMRFTIPIWNINDRELSFPHW